MSAHTACTLLARAFTTAADLVEHTAPERAAVYREISTRYDDEAAASGVVTLTGSELADARQVLTLATCWTHLTTEHGSEPLAHAVLVVGAPGDPTDTANVDGDTLRAIQQAARLVAADVAGWLPSAPDGEATWAHHALLSARRILAGTSGRPASA